MMVVLPKGCHDEDDWTGLVRFMELVALLPIVTNHWNWRKDGAAFCRREPFPSFPRHYYSHLLQDLCERDFRLYYLPREDDLRGRVRGRIQLTSYLRTMPVAAPTEFHVDGMSYPDDWDNRILWGAAHRHWI